MSWLHKYEVCRRYGLSAKHINTLVQAQAFPPPEGDYWSARTLEEFDRRNAEDARDVVQKVSRSEHDCEYCGDRFIAKRSDARYCSSKCRVYASRLRNEVVCA